ncbi:hypothetical protein Hanom_Chr17g01586191 [Helianthus anomalus]
MPCQPNISASTIIRFHVKQSRAAGRSVGFGHSQSLCCDLILKELDSMEWNLNGRPFFRARVAGFHKRPTFYA